MRIWWSGLLLLTLLASPATGVAVQVDGVAPSRIAVLRFKTPGVYQGTQLGRDLAESLRQRIFLPMDCSQISASEMQDAAVRANVDEDSVLIPAAAKRLAADLGARYIIAGEVVQFDQLERSVLAGKVATLFGFEDIKSADARVVIRLTIIDGSTGCSLRSSMASGRCSSSRILISRDAIRNAILTGQYGQARWNESRIGIAASQALDDATEWLKSLVEKQKADSFSEPSQKISA
ncbi:MAG: CsgG/HfaB family protein [Armatimonadota bacterium]